MVLWFKNDDKSKSKPKPDDDEEPPSTCVLLEIVSARDLSHKKSLLDQEVDPYCIVRLKGEEVHRTRSISNDPDPIWTVLTGSLCLLKIPTQEETKGEETKEERNDDAAKNDVVVSEETNSVVVEVCHGIQCLGIVTVPFSQVLESQGDCQEYPVCVSPGDEGDVVRDVCVCAIYCSSLSLVHYTVVSFSLISLLGYIGIALSYCHAGRPYIFWQGPCRTQEWRIRYQFEVCSRKDTLSILLETRY